MEHYFLYRTSCYHEEQSIIYIEQAVHIEYMWIHLIINYLKLEFIREFKEACPSLPSVSQSPSPCNQSSSHCDQNANRRDLDPCGPEGGHSKLQLFPGSGLEGK